MTRWARENREVLAAGAAAPARHEQEGSLCKDALCVLLTMLSVPERRRALRIIETRLRLTRGRGSELLLGRHPRELRKLPSVILGVLVSRPCLDAPIADRVAAATWLVLRAPLGRFQFVQLQPGSSLAAAIEESWCTDLVALDLPRDAVQRLTAAGIRIWHGVPGAGLKHQASLFDGHVLRRWALDEPCRGRRAAASEPRRA